MKLIDYMRREGIDDDAMAKQIGQCTGHAVKKWKYGERVPDANRILRIERITNRKVRLRDWGSSERAGAAA